MFSLLVYKVRNGMAPSYRRFVCCHICFYSRGSSFSSPRGPCHPS